MFKKRSIAVALLLGFCFSLTLFQMFVVSKKSRVDYQKLVASLQPAARDKHGKTQRGQVTKSLWVQKEDGLYQYIISSSDSILHINQNKQRDTHAIEKMDDITCYLQQKKFYVDKQGREVSKSRFPKQQICVLKINHGTYNYLTNQFLGDNVIVDMYELDGHELTTSIDQGKHLMDGICDSIDFSFDESDPRLKTHNLVANVHMDRSL